MQYLTLCCSASEIVELDHKFQNAYPAVSQPALPKVRQPTVRKSNISDGLGTTAVGVSDSDTANLTVKDLAEYLTKVSNHPVLRQALSWKCFVYARPNGLESLRAARAIEVRSDIATIATAPTRTVNAVMHNSSASHDAERRLAMPPPSTSTRLSHSPGRSPVRSGLSSGATTSKMPSFHSARTTPWRHWRHSPKFDDSAVRVDSHSSFQVASDVRAIDIVRFPRVRDEYEAA
jgi:hypothetical protein